RRRARNVPRECLLLSALIGDAIVPCVPYAFRHWRGTPDRPRASARRASRHTAFGTPEPASAPAERGPRRVAHRIAYSARRSSSGTAERAARTLDPYRARFRA